MPPKVWKKQTAAQQVNRPKPAEEPIKQVDHYAEELFVNPKNVMDNSKLLEKIRIYTSILAGIISGILNVNQLEGPLVYFGFHLLITALIALKVGKIDKFFLKKSDIISGLGSGALIFICAWMIFFNIVYIL